ncbi:MAG: hypothetical protein QM811_02550 [Pirellulales bacterium]
MKTIACLVGLILSITVSAQAQGPILDTRIISVRMPQEDLTLCYFEGSPSMGIELTSLSASIRGNRFYVGDGEIALLLDASQSRLTFQGTADGIAHGHVFKKGAKLQVLPGYKQVTDLKPGDVYLEFPGITFVLPNKGQP